MKITYEEAAYIRGYKQKHFMEKHFCDWYIEKVGDCSGHMKLRVKRWFYILAFIPAHIIQAFLCMWDGGLKEFGFEPRECVWSNVFGCSSDGADTTFGRFKEVWDKYNKE